MNTTRPALRYPLLMLAVSASLIPDLPAAANDMGVLNTIIVFPVAVVALVAMLVVGLWALLGLRRSSSPVVNVIRVTALVLCGGGSVVGAPVGVVLLEIWTDQHLREVTWNPLNFMIAGIVATAGLGCLALALLLGVWRVRTDGWSRAPVEHPADES